MVPASAEPQADLPTVDLQIDCEAPGLPGLDAIRDWICSTAEAAGKSLAPGAEVCVRVVASDEIRNLNRDYRGKDSPTNVLAFPAGLDELPGLPADDAGLLGDLVLCADVVTQEAAEQGKDPGSHWAHLLVHGTLHLLGFDHMNSDEADIMEGLERRILASRGIENPYETDEST